MPNPRNHNPRVGGSSPSSAITENAGVSRDEPAWCGVSQVSRSPRLAPRSRGDTRATDTVRVVGIALLIAVCMLITALAVSTLFAPNAQAGPTMRPSRSVGLEPDWFPALATWYGPGFYGHRLACAGRYPIGQPGPTTLQVSTQGVAHRTLPCGTHITLRLNGRTVRVRVIDRGPYSAALFDLTGATARKLEGVRRPYTTSLRWHSGWAK
jgi:hypothetical protein